jgi:hypothetical protein
VITFIDVYIPKLSLAFEYQGEPHYYTTAVYGSHRKKQTIDKAKLIACQAKGITIFEIPYWWDSQEQSLIATIHQHRPDLIPKATGNPIPAKSPEHSLGIETIL